MTGTQGMQGMQGATAAGRPASRRRGGRGLVAACLAAVLGTAGPALASEATRQADAAPHAGISTLRVCADPDSLPHSHRDGRGFELRIAELVAQELGATLAHAWIPHRGRFVRETVGAGRCDVFVGLPSGYRRVSATRPYYRSGYAFVQREQARPIRSLDDPRLGSLRIGVPAVRQDRAATAPGLLLERRVAASRIVPFEVEHEVPVARRIVEALDDGTIDIGLVWGPHAAWYAARAGTPMRFSLVEAPPDAGELPFEFPVSMAVRRGDETLLRALDAVLERRRADIDAILAAYRIPRTDVASN